MEGHRLCVLGTAPPAVVEGFLDCLAPEGSELLLYLRRGAAVGNVPAGCRRVDLERGVDAADQAQREAFVRFGPTDVVIVCDREYWHDNVLEAVLDWSARSAPAPRVHVYLHQILFNGYLEVIRRHPRLTRPAA